MGLRKLSHNASHSQAPLAADVEATIRRYQEKAEMPSSPRAVEALDHEADVLSPRVATDLQTPPPSHREFSDDEAEAHTATFPTTAPRNTTIDAFTAALDALRSTLRDGSPAPRTAAPEIDKAPVTAPAAPVAEELPPVVETPAPFDATMAPAEVESASALETMPVPSAPEEIATPERNLYQLSPVKKGSRPDPARREAPATIESALQAVREAVPGLNVEPPKSDTPVGTKRPASDGIPKSVSENLPKYPARPKMRVCTRCGHDTKLRDAKCQKCSYVDESLGILDAVIAGDIARVEQVLLVRPHLITLRTSRHDWTLLHMAASGGNPKMTELLIEKGAAVNASNRDGKTALHYAAGKGHLGIVEILLKHFADPSALYNGKSALDLARKNGHREIEELLREKSAG